MSHPVSHPSVHHIERECHESFIQGKIHIQQNSLSKTLNIGKAKFQRVV